MQMMQKHVGPGLDDIVKESIDARLKALNDLEPEVMFELQQANIIYSGSRKKLQ